MKALQKYFKKRKNAITFLLEKQQEKFTADTFHNLRLEIKKLKALFDLINSCSRTSKQKKIVKPFKLIFSQAGKIRELQVEETLLEKHFGSDFVIEYRKDLKKILMEESTVFFLITSPSFTEKLQKKYIKINDLLKKVTKKRASRYMDKKRTEIEQLLHKKALKNKQMHALRKRFKEYQFNKQSLNYTKKNKFLSMKTTLTELLGDWHDYETVIEHLIRVVNSREINPKENDHIEKIIKTFTFRKALLFTEIQKTLTSIV